MSLASFHCSTCHSLGSRWDSLVGVDALAVDIDDGSPKIKAAVASRAKGE